MLAHDTSAAVGLDHDAESLVEPTIVTGSGSAARVARQGIDPVWGGRVWWRGVAVRQLENTRVERDTKDAVFDRVDRLAVDG